MLFSKILLASLVGAASAFSIPKGTEEGVYDHHVDANGNDVFVKLANATNYSGKKLSPYSPQPFTGRFKREETAHCSPGPELDHRVSPLPIPSAQPAMPKQVLTRTRLRIPMQPTWTSTGSATTTTRPNRATASSRSAAAWWPSFATSATTTSASARPRVAGVRAGLLRRSATGIAPGLRLLCKIRRNMGIAARIASVSR